MINYINIVFLVLSFLAILLFLRFLIYFFILIVFNKLNKRKVLKSGILGISSFLLVVIVVKIILLYIKSDLSEKLSEIIEEKNVEIVKVDGKPCSEMSYLLIKDLSTIGEKETVYRKTEKRIGIEIITGNEESVKIDLEKIKSSENKYLVFYPDLIITERNHVGTVKTDYLLECINSTKSTKEE